MLQLFSKEPIIFNLQDLEMIYYPNLFDEEESNLLLKELIKTTKWQQDIITVFNKNHLQPRLTAFYGNDGKPYSYSNITMEPHFFTPMLSKIKHFVEAETNTNFNAVLLNYYRNGNDSMGWHSDNEKELGENPIIASVTFGAERIFQLKHNTIIGLKQNIKLESGSLLLMKGSTQHFWKHQIPKTTKPVGERVNLTFRLIK
jgi:alkylated DNA repair dioxygenase AlkB